MRIHWKPAVELPPFEAPTSILIAWPADDGGPAFCNFAHADFTGVRVEGSGDAPDGDWYWITEDELLAGVPAVSGAPA